MAGRRAGTFAVAPALLCAPLVLVPLVLCALQWAPSAWLGARMAELVSSRSGRDVSIGALDLDVFARRPSASASSITIGGGGPARPIDIDRIDASIELAALLGGALVVDRITVRGARLALRREADGTVPRIAAPAISPSDAREAVSSLPRVRRLELDDVDVSLVDVVTGTEARFRLSATGATGADAGDWHTALDGTLDGVPLEATATLSSLEALLDPDRSAALAVSLALADASVTIDGTLDDPATLAGLELDIDLSLPNVHALPRASRTSLKALPPLALTTRLTRDGPFYSAEHLRLALGRTALDGDVRLDPATSPVTLYANLAASTLDLDALATALGAVGEAGDGGGTDAPTGLAEARTTVLPSVPLGLSGLFDRARGALHLRAERILYAPLPLESFDLRATLSPHRLTLEPLALELSEGRLSGSLKLKRAADEPARAVEATAALKLGGLALDTLLAFGDLPATVSGRLGAELKLWASGDSVAELAASLDGGGFALLRGGTLDALLAHLGTLALVRSAKDALTPWEERTPIRCGYLDVHGTDGVLELERFVIDTEDTAFLGQGRIDLGAETLDLLFEPHSKGLRIPGGAVPLAVGGTFARPTIRSDPSLSPHGAAATLAEAAARALTLVPLPGRASGPPAPWCDALGEAHDAR